MTDPKQHVLTWLKDSHAAAEQAATMMDKFRDRLEHYPELQTRLEQHASQRQQQTERLEQCMERLGSKPSAVKDTGTRLIGYAQSLSGMFTSDEVMKGVLATWSFEQMEIASYRMLIKASDQLGEPEIQRACTQNLEEKRAMVQWLDEHMESITEKFLQLEADEVTVGQH